MNDRPRLNAVRLSDHVKSVAAQILEAQREAADILSRTGVVGRDLTDREYDCLVAISEGKGNKEIANEMFLTMPSVRSHLQQVYRKLGARDRAHAVSLAYQRHLLHIPDDGATE